MPDSPNAEIVAIGTEILLGEITDTNSVYLARQLRDIGVNIFFMTTVGDNLGRIAGAISAALDRAEIVITTGGLGPTVDDMTRQAVADVFERPLEFHTALYQSIEERFRGFGVEMTANNRQQAYLPQCAALIENPVGTAPAFFVESERGMVISLPGVPREMKYLMTESVVPILLQRYELGVIVARTLRTAGIGESSLDDKIGREILNERNPSVGLAAHHGAVDVRITAKAESRSSAVSLLDAMQARLEDQIGDDIFGVDEATLEDVVWSHLKESNSTIYVTEAGLPGVISDAWSADSDRLRWQYYDDPTQVFDQFDVKPADVSLTEFATDVAARVRQREGVDASVVVLSYPNLDENADVEQGSAVAISTASQTRFRGYGFGSRSSLAREWISRWGLASLWRMLKEERG
ncbi:MAG: CinA family nicotinamide mononucleotide deamidase-related protein [Chloroflexota bacterium]|nr:CinA family nicotinamide mononucleotide deamidase-related protein [Chloroflexota bacterium]